MILRDRVMEVFHHERQVGDHTDLVAQSPVLGKDNRFSIGFDYNWVRFHLLTNNPAAGSSPVPLNNPSPGLFVDLARSPTVPVSLSHAHAFSAFAEDRWSIAPKLALVGGVRYDVTKVDRQDLAVLTSSSRTFTPVTGRGGLTLNVRPKLVVYGQYATGTDSIGDQLSQNAQQQVFDLSSGKQVEAGVKQTFLNDRAEWTVAVYRILKNRLLVPDTNNPTLSQQVGQQSSHGVEVSAMLPAGDNARIEANGAWLRARFDDFSENVRGQIISRNGNHPPNVPLQTANVWLTWNPARMWQARTGLRYVGERFIDNANTLRMPSYLVTDAGVRRRLTDKVSLDLRLYNVFDQIYTINFWNGNAGAPQWILGAPRSAEVGLAASF
jgi:iron complex outermembrane receptor protein